MSQLTRRIHYHEPSGSGKLSYLITVQKDGHQVPLWSVLIQGFPPSLVRFSHDFDARCATADEAFEEAKKVLDLRHTNWQAVWIGGKQP